MLEVLRADDPGMGPQPGLGEIERLIGNVRDAGLPVEFSLEGPACCLPAGMDLAAYRIVQEALTNTVKHGGRATARVTVRYTADTLEIEVVDDGRGAAAPLLSASDGGGHGLIGMKERVGALRRRAANRAGPDRRLPGLRPDADRARRHRPGPTPSGRPPRPPSRKPPCTTGASRPGTPTAPRIDLRHPRSRDRAADDGPGRAAASNGTEPASRPRENRGRAMTTRVLLVDDQPLLRTGFRMILSAESDLTVVGEAGDGASAVELARRLKPDVVLMDIRMPGMDGIQATRALAGPGVEDPIKVLMLTTFGLDEYVVESLRAGASGFLLKDAPAEDLVEAIRIVAAGEALLAPSVTRRLLDRVASRLPPANENAIPALSELTERELEVLKLLARGLSNAEIAEKLVVSETTVKTHVSRVLAKLDLRDRVQAVILAYETGLV